MQLDALQTIKLLFSEVNPIPVKAALNVMGYDFGNPRLPLVPMTTPNRERLQIAMENLGILKV
jgi:4-hydroxy-tetrahydrodipicolinate synthase